MPGLTALAIDLGGSHFACAVVRDGVVLASNSLPADGTSSLAALLPSIQKTLSQLLVDTHIPLSDCSAVVLGFPGVVSAREKRVLATNEKFNDATQLNLNSWFQQAFGLPFLLENDARLALLGECRFGAACGAHDAVMITLGSGIGGAAMLNGQLLQSQHGLAGTIGGHIPITLNGRLCTCGNRGCAEAEGSTTFLPEIYRQQIGGDKGELGNSQTIGFAELFRAIESGDKPAIAALQHCLRVWSVLTVALIHAYDPEVVVFGGAVLKRANDILPHLQEYVAKHAWTPGRTVPLRAAALGSDAALLGAIQLMEYSL
ncbi:MAG: ROK family protein [Acidobacteriaceae bacterium]|nr:ROK family protein [Acidobacteriaceae bacterium]